MSTNERALLALYDGSSEVQNGASIRDLIDNGYVHPLPTDGPRGPVYDLTLAGRSRAIALRGAGGDKDRTTLRPKTAPDPAEADRQIGYANAKALCGQLPRFLGEAIGIASLTGDDRLPKLVRELMTVCRELAEKGTKASR